MAGRLVNALGAAPAAAEAFSDAATLRHMLRFEAALARAVAQAGLIPKKFAGIVAAACDPALYDPEPLAEAARRTATLTVPVVKALTAEVAKRDPDAAGYVHWGATSQDVIDTAMVLQLGEALPPLLKEIEGIVAAFATLAKKHRATPMLGRTLLQPATPLALGQKIAGWASDLDRARRRLAESFAETQVLQFGGASGSLSALGGKAEAVMTALATDLELALAPAPWFAQRVRLAAFAQDCTLVCGALGKAARDISLMMQVEVGEASEPSGPDRGGSSTMPHKRNPVGSTLVLAAANRAPHLAATIVSGMVQEHERALGGWQSEWPTLAALVETLGSSLQAMAEVAPGLVIDTDAIQANMDAADAAVFAERATFLLAGKMGKQKAAALVEKALAKGGSFVEALGQLRTELGDEQALLGHSSEFVDRLLEELHRK
ncbi:3-carboxy-cis,cis-muconate cycloisomerase [Enhydrobacter sp.]|jgi:3-carboxy-cis,cis-muconate cycloisomerase|uniref:3-carboxy-cis,cis-muconate cycloisomerase n=1 Tax=Enhydrobacter sp. TaxID=1894999 RepID=UPI002632E455|nr:3-carboxy-cis,cis-muconate cycloisomerase [Enhydrobacter sp.]WIM12118.1 MAG: 3-carboxy-cis,cis-muconate cycloisomerase [Enhydrobacter sp.]